MKILGRLTWGLALGRDSRGQDMIEYALRAGFIAVAVGAVAPGMANSMTLIYSHVASRLSASGG